MSIHRSFLAAAIAVATVCLAEAGSAAVSTPESCDSLKLRAVGKYSLTHTKCHADAVASSSPVDPVCLARAELRLVQAFARAEAGGACRVEGDAAATASRTGACLVNVVGPDMECGNLQIEGSEECEDGNFDNGDGCSPYCELEHTYDVVFQLDSSELVGSLQIKVDYDSTVGTFDGAGANVDCASLIGDSVSSFNDDDDGRLGIALISLGGFEGPGAGFATCRFSAGGPAPDTGGLALTILQANSINATPLSVSVSIASITPVP